MSETCVTATSIGYVPPPLLPRFRDRERHLLADFLARQSGSLGLVMVSLPAPLADPADLLAADGGEGFVYLPPAGRQFAGLGRAAGIAARGEDRFSELARQATAIASGASVPSLGPGEHRPLFFGGVAFAPGGADDGPWGAFGDASFVLPRWLYSRQGGRASLGLALFGHELERASRREEWLDQLFFLNERLAAGRLVLPAPPPGLAASTSLAEVEQGVEKAVAEIGAGSFEKVVLAMRLAAEAAAPIDSLAAFRRLRASAAGRQTAFLFRRGGATFFGATPELLVASRGTHLSTEALAGTRRPEETMEDLEKSDKNRREHAIVVESIVEALAPLCRRLEVAPARVRRLRGLSHLLTAISGELPAPLHVLELAARLHPTPAVGGWPRRPALDFLAGQEKEPRGWYAGPIGYFDDRGDGELRVALRSAIVCGRRATLYAGAGIVAGSAAPAELEEMKAKAAPMLAALGVPRAADAVHEPFTHPRHA
jgi:menaquinone-specific isochorismate synthase